MIEQASNFSEDEDLVESSVPIEVSFPLMLNLSSTLRLPEHKVEYVLLLEHASLETPLEYKVAAGQTELKWNRYFLCWNGTKYDVIPINLKVKGTW